MTSIGNDAFCYCSGLTEVTIPNSVTSIGTAAFLDCSGLTEVTIPSSVTSIGTGAFSNCSSLTELTIPSSVTSISLSAFSGCVGLEKITVESGNPNYDSREDCNAIITIKSSWLVDSNTLIAGCKSTMIPGSVTAIGAYAFSGCSGLTEVTIPNSVTLIDQYAFSGCSGLTTLYSLSTTPPRVLTKFDDSHYTTVDLFVPEEALEAYQTAGIWKDFQKLHAIDGSTDIVKVSAAEQIHSANGQVTVTGLADDTTVAVYDLSGKQVGTATSTGGQVNISTGMTAGAAAIVKMGDKSVKTVMK